MNRFQKVVVLFALSMFLVFVPLGRDEVKAWNPIAHWQIAAKAAQDLGLDGDFPDYANVPDYWPSDIGFYQINPFFCWSHAVIDRNNGASPGRISPLYPDDGRYPEFDMWYLAKYKMKTAFTSEMQKTILGYACHNAADRIVHWTYFTGGLPGEGPIDTYLAWRTGHADKETWADYVVFQQIVVPVGWPVWNPDGTPVLQMVINCKADPSILQLAQKIYVKNGRKCNSNGTGTITAENNATITGHVSTFNTQWANPAVRSLNRDTWGGYQLEAIAQGWTQSACLVKYNTSVTLAESWINSVRSLAK